MLHSRCVPLIHIVYHCAPPRSSSYTRTHGCSARWRGNGEAVVGLCSCGHLSMKEPLKFSNDLTRKSLRAFGSLYLFGDMIRRNPPKTTGSVGRARVQAKVRLGKETGSHMQRSCARCAPARCASSLVGTTGTA